VNAKKAAALPAWVKQSPTVLAELKRQGNNLNQITRNLNERGEFGESAKSVMNECCGIYKGQQMISLASRSFVARNGSLYLSACRKKGDS